MAHSALRHIEWDVCLLEPQRDREVELYMRRALGHVPPMARYLAPIPWVVRSIVGMSAYGALLAHTELRMADLVGIIVSQDRSCRYCYAATRVLLRLQGYPETRIRQLEGDLLAAELDQRERAGLKFARILSRANPRPGPAELEALRVQGFDDAAARELAFVVVSFVYYTILSTLPALSPEGIERLPDRLYVRMFRPFFSKLAHTGIRRGHPEAMPPEAEQGPFGRIVGGLSGLPSARAVRRVLDEALSPTVISPRAKMLIFGVIARGLGSTYAEKEAARIAGQHGIDPKDFDHAVAHLSSPALQPLESVLLSEARQTIRYRPIEMQRRARALLDQISVPQFVEFVGIAALANAVCRLGLVFDALE